MKIAIAAALAVAMQTGAAAPNAPPRRSCFPLYTIGCGAVRRNPSTSCATRVSPQSTFKIPHALAALDAGVIKNVDETIKYDGRQADFDAWKRNHTLATAMRFSVVW